MKRKIISIEILFSVVIIIFMIFIITLLCLEIKLYSQRNIKKSEATIMAENILENLKSRSYNDIETYIDEISYIGISKKIEDNVQYVIVSGKEFNDKFFGTEISNDYIVEMKIENLNLDFNIIKNISIDVTYYINGKEENVELSTAIERENINECNEPIISDEYFQDLGINEYEYDIVPIKYSENANSFVTTTKDDKEWFNYSAKKWAKVLVFSKDADNIQDLFIQDDGLVKSSVNYNNFNINLTDYIYVWIPNFSIKDDITYFRYGTGKKAIKMDFLYNNGKYLYLYKALEEINDISNECSFEGVYGVWRKFGDEQDIYYQKFNSTKYGPINIY